MAVFGYARVSTHEQTLDLQQDALEEAGATITYVDIATGKDADRPELKQCLKALRTGDTLLVWRLDRLGRSVQDLVRIVKDLLERGVKLQSLKESINTDGPVGTLMFHLFAALAEFERGLVVERTNAGLAAARARGRTGGRPRALTTQQQRNAIAMMRNREIPVADIAMTFGVSRSTLYNLVKSAKSQ